MKKYLIFILSQSFEIWLWCQVFLIFLGRANHEYSIDELFWYYIAGIFITIAAMGLVHFFYKAISKKLPVTQHEVTTHESKKPLGIKGYVGLFGIIVVLISVAPSLWETSVHSLADTILPALSLQFILLLFCYKVGIYLTTFYFTKEYTKVENEAAHLLFQLLGFINTVFALVFLEEYFIPGAFSYQNFLLLAIPTSILINFLLERREEKRI